MICTSVGALGVMRRGFRQDYQFRRKNVHFDGCRYYLYCSCFLDSSGAQC